MNAEQVAKGLGVASIGIGLTEIIAPRQVESMLGIEEGRHHRLLTALGMRELMHGVAILSQRDPAPGVWSRVVGDVIDTALLAATAAQTRRPARFVAVTLMVLGIGAADAICAWQLANERGLVEKVKSRLRECRQDDNPYAVPHDARQPIEAMV